MAPKEPKGGPGGPGAGQQRPQGQPAGGRVGGRGPHGGGRGANPAAPGRGRGTYDNGSASERPSQQAAAESAPGKSGGGWGSGISFKDKLLAAKQEAKQEPPPAPVAELNVAAKPANGPEAAKPAADAAVPVAAASAEGGSDIQFGSFAEVDVAPSKEQPEAPAGPLPTAVPAAVEAVCQQSRQVQRTNSAPASAQLSSEGRTHPIHIPHRISRMAVATQGEGSPTAAPPADAPAPVAPAAPAAPAEPAPVPAPVPPPPAPVPPPPAPAPPPAREGHQRAGPPAQAPTGVPPAQPHPERAHGRQGGHERQQQHAGPMPYAHAGSAPAPPQQHGGPAGQHHGQQRHGQHPPPPPQQGYGPGPGGQGPQHHHMQQQQQQHQHQQQQQQGGPRGGGRGGPGGPQQMPVQMQMAMPMHQGYPQPHQPYGMAYAHPPSQPMSMAQQQQHQQQHAYAAAAAQHGQMQGPGQHMGPPPYMVGSPSQYGHQFMAMDGAGNYYAPHMGQQPVAVPIIMPMAQQHPHGPIPQHGSHVMSSSPTIGFHVPPPPQHAQHPQHAPAPGPGGYGQGVPQPPPMAIAIPPPGPGAGSSAPAPAAVFAAAQAAINATNAAAPVSAVSSVVPSAQPAQPAHSHAPGPVPVQPVAAPPPPNALPSGGSGSAASPPPPTAVAGSAASAKAVSTPPPPPAKKVLKIMDPSSHKEVNLAGSAAAPAGAVAAAAGAAVADAKVVPQEAASAAAPAPPAPMAAKPAIAPSAQAPAPPPRKVLEIKEPTARPPKVEHKPAEVKAQAPPPPAAAPAPVVVSAPPAAAAAVAAPAPTVAAPAPAVAASAAAPAAPAPVAPAPAPAAAASPVNGPAESVAKQVEAAPAPAAPAPAPAAAAVAAAPPPPPPVAAAAPPPPPPAAAAAPQPADAAAAAPAAAPVQAPAAVSEAAAPAAAMPAREPSSFQIDVAEEEEGDDSSKAAVAAAPPAAETSTAPAPAAAAPAEAPAEDATAAASASGAGSGSASGDEGAAGSSGAGGGARNTKKNLKQMMKDADAKGANRDMLSAFREPPPPPKVDPEAVAKAKEVEARAAAPALPTAPSVTDNWEERADESPESPGPSGAADAADTRHRYSRDYMMSIGTRMVVPLQPDMLDAQFVQILGLEKPQDNTRIGAGQALGRAGSREAEWGRGRDERGGPGGRGGDFRGGEMRMDRAASGGLPGSGPRDAMRAAGPGRGGAGPTRGSATMEDGWQRRGPPPPPSPGGDMRNRGLSGRTGSGSVMPGGYGGGGVQLHKSESRWQVGVSVAEDPEEDKKQKTFKGILNKLTPDNYDKLKQQILAVPITHQMTLEGFINQIFDKALIETTFSEMYANLCKEIHPSLPTFPSGDPASNKPVDFRRLLLNKCQQEFEDGATAMKKVKAREKQEEAEKKGKGGKSKEADKEADKEEAADNGKAEVEEGEVPAAPAAPAVSAADEAKAKAKAKAKEEAEEAQRDLKARRRMLGNIQFIGHLYKCGLLTDRIIHSCIVQLLSDEESPRPDDIECLCKLFTTLGKQLEEQSKLQQHRVNPNNPNNKQAIDIYFERMSRLRHSSDLDSRIKFAIQDVLELRAAKYVSRRKVEGPKRIEDVHREAQQQLAAQATRDRDERYGGSRGGPSGRSGGGPGMDRGRDAPPPPGRGFGAASQDEARLMGRGEVARPLRGGAMERQASAEVSLRPSSFLTTKRTGSPAQPAGLVAAPVREAIAAATRPHVPSAAAAAAAAAGPPRAVSAPAPPPPPAGMSEEAATKRGASWVKELYELREKGPAAEALTSLKAEGAPMGVVLAAAVREAFEVRGIDPAVRLDLLKEVLVEQLTATDGQLNSSMLEEAFGRFMGDLHTWVEDNPKAAGVASKAVGELAAKGHLSLGPCLRPILEANGDGGEEEGGSDLPPLVEAGVAGEDILKNVLQAASDVGGMEKAAELWRASGLEAARFYEMPEDVDKLAEQFAFVR